jgi:hypothetical protein
MPVKVQIFAVLAGMQRDAQYAFTFITEASAVPTLSDTKSCHTDGLELHRQAMNRNSFLRDTD